ncbi:MAG: nucleotidyltransferase domain-containing protein [Firmicutes bacterium]|nr:nucleotidyltransferase domain-containing protein [Bacillota bacterium]
MSKRIQPQPQQLIAKLEAFFADRAEVIFAYLFGSQARAQAGPLSDIDIAVFLNDTVEPAHYTRYRLELWGALSALLHRNDIDIVVLNRAPVLLRHRVLRDGKLILCRNEGARINFTIETGRRFWDTAHLRRLSFRYMERHIKMGTFGKAIDYKRVDG